jgi:phenylalanyl-tRNA synthetase beta chain
MRSSLIGSLLQVLKFNLDRKAERVRVFELGRVFLRDASVQTTDSTVRGVHQPMKVAGLSYGTPDGLQWARKAAQGDFYDAKGDVQALLSPLQAEFARGSHPAMHPGRCAVIRVAGQDVGFVGELHPRWRQQWELPHTPLLFELDLDAVIARQVPAFEAVPRFQPAERDIAVIVGEQVTHDQLLAAIRSADTGGLLRNAMLFDVYRPQQASAGLAMGEKSLAVRLTLARTDATLTDEQIDTAVRAVVERISAQLGGRLRG